jgi:hypothetical protein
MSRQIIRITRRGFTAGMVLGPGALLKAAGEADRPGVVQCANLTYGNGQTSKCFAHHFLEDIQKQTNIWTSRGFSAVKLEDAQLFKYPFAVMTGEGAFTLTDAQRKNLREYLTAGGFLVASAGCSSEPWRASIRREVEAVFPDVKLTVLPPAHPIFHTVYDIAELRLKHKGEKADLEGLTIDGRVVMVYSADGLNDTSNAGGNCCCCGGNEVLNARQVNVNLLVYAVTH